MLAIRSLLFNICFFTWTVLLVICSVPLLFVDRQGVRRVGVAWARGTIWLLRLIIGAKFEVRGAYLGGARLVAAKHQSAFDTMVFYILAADPVYVMKDELTRIPIFSRLARHQRMIIVDHANWLNTGEITRDVPVRDVSRKGDWSQVQVWNVQGRHWGVNR